MSVIMDVASKPRFLMDLTGKMALGTLLGVTGYFWLWRSRAANDLETPLSGINFKSMLQLLRSTIFSSYFCFGFFKQ